MFQRLKSLIRGFFGLFISGLEANNPEALIEAEKENLRNQIGRFNENLSSHAAFAERLRRQVKALSAKGNELTAKIKANLKAGNKRVAGQLALQLQTVKQQYEENQQQLEAAEKNFESLERSRDASISEAQHKIEKLQTMLTETQLIEAQADLQEMAKGMIGSIGTNGESMSRISAALEERHDKAVGKARVAIGYGKDELEFNKVSLEMKETEMEALGDAALAEFAATNGFDAEFAQITNAPEGAPKLPQGAEEAAPQGEKPAE